MFENLVEVLQEKKGIASLIGLGAVIGLAFIFFRQPAQVDQVPSVTALASQVVSEEQAEASSDPTVPSQNEDKRTEAEQVIMVDVKGAVQKPGLYSMKLGDRLADAIAKAGGLTEEADGNSINLAQKLSDEAVVYIASQGEDISVITSSVSTKEGQSEEKGSSLINLNTASLAELQTISGIGAKRAQDIIDYREANGGFKTVDDLKKVSGIGDKTIEKLRDYVSVD
ncbi:helix-hairpin-helix domain-containing protein [Streptococcus moroccensis]|uniref:Competence protein ComEA n=1 Tax=Streptococcus moroccensis TaxID=1451356 RepID=A0ABT9YQ58_9STRE|nr:helix-hairpin-helix domain-containing protein [Streptococcus moroccensis]MDQ0222134.1 competence protein ComEA [Streptococcus moroccensis]